MWNISPISPDWVEKGFHLHYKHIEIVMRPDHRGGIVFKKFFRSTPDQAVEPVIKLAAALLEDPEWRRKFRETLARAQVYCRGQGGALRQLAHARTLEFKFLIIALDNLER